MDLKEHSCNLNIKYDLPREILDKLIEVYQLSDGWIGFGDGSETNKDIPFWFNQKEEGKFVYASMEPSGLNLTAQMTENEWTIWLTTFKANATSILTFKVGELELGEVTEELEFLPIKKTPSKSNNFFKRLFKS